MSRFIDRLAHPNELAGASMEQGIQHNSASPDMGTSGTASMLSYSTTQQLPVARPDARIKICCVGDGGVGKTCLLIVYHQNRFPTDYVPTVFENYVTNVSYDSKVVEVALWDTAGQEEYDRLRPLSYPETSVILICFAVDYPASLENVEEKWFPEVAHFCDGVPIILIATKIDLRQDQRAIDLLKAQGRMPTTSLEGSAVAKRLGAKYMEVSAINGAGVQEVFSLALKEAMKSKTLNTVKRKMKCQIL